MINRRSFLKLLVVAAAAPAVAKALPAAPPKPKYVPYQPPPQPMGWYSGYDMLPCRQQPIVSLTPEEMAAVEARIDKAEKEMQLRVASLVYDENPLLKVLK